MVLLLYLDHPELDHDLKSKNQDHDHQNQLLHRLLYILLVVYLLLVLLLLSQLDMLKLTRMLTWMLLNCC